MRGPKEIGEQGKGKEPGHFRLNEGLDGKGEGRPGEDQAGTVDVDRQEWRADGEQCLDEHVTGPTQDGPAAGLIEVWEVDEFGPIEIRSVREDN